MCAHVDCQVLADEVLSWASPSFLMAYPLPESPGLGPGFLGPLTLKSEEAPAAGGYGVV